MLTTGRNPFARESISAEIVSADHPTGPTCAWCGGHGVRSKSNPNRYYLRRYRVTPESGRSGYVAGARLFCSIVCARSYIGE
jgi:hypothetical protein